MIPNIFTGEPAWLILLCLLGAIGYSLGLYFRDVKNEFPLYLKILLGLSRFIAVFLISFLLLSPFIRSITKEKEKPLIIVAIDNSASIRVNSDSSAYQEEFLRELDELSSRLSAIADIRPSLFGGNLKQLKQGEVFTGNVAYNEPITDISGLISNLGDLYFNRNVGALILASDGIYNTGANPVYQAKEWSHPIYTIALGDTTLRMDVILAKVNFNRMVFLNNKFPIEVIVRANDASGKQSKVHIYHKGKPVFEESFVIDKDDYTKRFQCILDARESGLQKYTIAFDPVEGELSIANNRKEIFVEVLDSKSKVLIISGAPHPDLAALNEAISSNMNYEVIETLLEDFRGDVEEYSMVILHQLPSVDYPATSLIRSIAEKEIPALFILGVKSDLSRFNQYQTGLNIISSVKPLYEEALPVTDQGFSAFSLSESLHSWFPELPPLIVPLGEYQFSNSARVMLNQRLGSVETTRPLIMLNETLDGRTGVITGEGLWKWRLYDYAKNNDHQSFNELINKIIQYLSLKDQKKNFRIYSQRNFREIEAVVFDAELYNENYELTNEPEVEISLQNGEGSQFPFVFNKTGNAYRLDAGIFPPDNYTYQAKATLGGNTYVAQGQFSISAIDLEALNTVAAHHLLYQMAQDNGGKMFYPGELSQLADNIIAREDIRPVTYTQKKYEDLLNEAWVLFLIIGLLTLEWFLRKRAGSY